MSVFTNVFFVNQDGSGVPSKRIYRRYIFIKLIILDFTVTINDVIYIFFIYVQSITQFVTATGVLTRTVTTADIRKGAVTEVYSDPATSAKDKDNLTVLMCHRSR